MFIFLSLLLAPPAAVSYVGLASKPLPKAAARVGLVQVIEFTVHEIIRRKHAAKTFLEATDTQAAALWLHASSFPHAVLHHVPFAQWQGVAQRQSTQLVSANSAMLIGSGEKSTRI
jgi:hypothetical protein